MQTHGPLLGQKHAAGQATLRSDGHSAYQLTRRIRDFIATFAHVLDGQQDGLTRVGQRLVRRLALAVAAGKRRHDGDIAAVWVGLENDVVSGFFHALSLSCAPTTGHRHVESLQNLGYARS